MRIKWTGAGDRDLAVAGGFLHCPRNKWVDVEPTAAKTGIAVDHAVIVARSVEGQDGWELELEKAPKSRAKEQES